MQAAKELPTILQDVNILIINGKSLVILFSSVK